MNFLKSLRITTLAGVLIPAERVVVQQITFINLFRYKSSINLRSLGNKPA